VPRKPFKTCWSLVPRRALPNWTLLQQQAGQSSALQREGTRLFRIAVREEHSRTSRQLLPQRRREMVEQPGEQRARFVLQPGREARVNDGDEPRLVDRRRPAEGNVGALFCGGPAQRSACDSPWHAGELALPWHELVLHVGCFLLADLCRPQ
jgi:hypothetical protein